MKQFRVIFVDFGSEVCEHLVCAFTEFGALDLFAKVKPFATVVRVLECPSSINLVA